MPVFPNNFCLVFVYGKLSCFIYIYYISGSFRVLQRYALRASTAAPTVFKPVMMGNEMYCDGGIVASNPTAVALHEARSIFPDVPVEMVVSLGTGGMYSMHGFSLAADSIFLRRCKPQQAPQYLFFANTNISPQDFWKRRALHGLGGTELLVRL